MGRGDLYMNASELIHELELLTIEHGNLPVYAEVDWDYVGCVVYQEKSGYYDECFILST